MLLSLLVICRHCGQSFSNLESPGILYVFAVGGLSTLAVPTFFVISGFFFFSKQVTGERLKRQIIRILRLYIIWVIIYMPLTIKSMIEEGLSFKISVVTFFQNLVFSATYYHLWYLPSLTVALLLVYWFSRRIKNKWLILIGVCLYGIALLGNTYLGLFASEKINSLFFIYNKIFITTRNGLFVGTPFMIAGKIVAEKYEYLNKVWIHRKRFIITVNIIAVCGVIAEALIINRWKMRTINDVLLMDIFCIAFVIAFVNMDISFIKNWDKTSSTFMYCIHPLVIVGMSYLEKIWNVSISTVGNSLCVICISVCSGYLIAYLKCKWKVSRLLT